MTSDQVNHPAHLRDISEKRAMSFQANRRMDIRIYFSDSPTPLDVLNVCHLGTEGGLLRVVTDGGHDRGGETQWWPLCHVFNVRLLARRELAQDLVFMGQGDWSICGDSVVDLPEDLVVGEETVASC